MNDLAKIRLDDYETGFRGMHLERGPATREAAHDAMCHAGQSAIEQSGKKRAEHRKQ